MARVVLAADISGTRNGKVWPRIGSEVDLPDAEADDMVRAGTAVRPDDPRVGRLRGGYHAGDVGLAGAPTGRDATEGQPDTNLARARFLADKHKGNVEAVRAETREAAERVNYTDDETVFDGRGVNDGPVVGDDEPAPALNPGAVEPNPTVAERSGDDDASGLVEVADAATEGEERAVARTQPRKRA